MDLQTSAEAVQHRDAAVLAAVRDAIQASGGGSTAEMANRIAALQLAQSQTEAQLAAVLLRSDAQQLQAAALRKQLQVLPSCCDMMQTLPSAL